jgi:predicted amidohydrolase YtcJ
VAGFKIFADGVMEYPTQTAAMSVPYKNSGQSGALMIDPEKFKLFVTEADRDGNMVHVHAIGDRAVTVALDAYDVARKQNHSDSLPHSITHLQVVNPKDIPRFKSLNVIASMQLLWATADVYTMDLVKPYIDEKLFVYQYPAKSLFNAGATVSGASDWPVSSANPFDAIYTAETRTGRNGVLNEKEIMPRPEMLKAYTIYAARTLRQEKLIGSIKKGKQADFVLVDRDVMNVSSDSVKATRVVWTMFGGQKVFVRK